ncbi:FecR domain-containing protein [Pseudoalteromonas sp. SG45-5]|uniref:FecR family protein n=1 Tax=unclassified Pseudoalteromonas TaxID=194690 RepID=UPI0015FD9B15|nr:MULTISPECIES: FecR domain-containing protein [unclassified Pseudoalteromonas]MBB1384879.1 FecR domain-containing protein [Pseudoalteromonas sp. SG45-5]MBB1392725.1 FecR domain-containing protein [Pseudoalteromonas sp. SG44-4]MBB1445651.1 FecR domain-containing protein [Pseudoalteromonas sp. SG41-6]
MSNVHPFTSKNVILEKACTWVSAIDRGLSNEEKEQFKLWMLQSVAHQDAVYEIAQLWDELSVLNELSILFPQHKSANHSKGKWVVPYSIAASLFAALMVCSYLLVNLENDFDKELAKVNYTKIYQTKVGEQATYVLPDGTIVQLNTNSMLEVAYSKGRRQLLLNKGEGRFNVAKDVSRPFSVMAGDKSFTALGTVFNVQRNTSSDLELVVTEGKVMITDPSVAVDANDFKAYQLADNSTQKIRQINANIVTSGEKAVIEQSITKPITQLSVDDVQRDLAWQNGMLIFNGEQLGDALNEVSRYTATRFKLSSAELAKIKVAGVFRAGDVAGLLESLQTNFSIDHERLGEHVVSLKYQTKS